MTNKCKRAIAGVMAVVTMAVSSIGMSASAYAPTITRTVGGVKGTLYSDTTYASSTTTKSGTTCYVKLKHGGASTCWVYGTGYVKMTNYTTNGSSSATSWHKTGSVSTFSIVC